MKFINRTTEREFLNNEYTSKESSLVIIYGRRRIGKTALITQFCKDKNALYFLATEESEIENRNNFKELVSEYTGNELLGSAIIKKWDVIFKSIIDYKTSDKKVIVIDEFQYLGKGNPAFPSIFQKVWDTILKEANIMVILCGSLITMMESQTLSYNSPLYGRRTGQIKLQQISFEHYREFYPKMKKKELIEYYSVTGGVPKYIELFKEGNDIYSSIENNVLGKSSFLYEEPTFLLQHEVSEIGSYFSIIKTIAAGNQKLSKIATVLEQPQSNLTKYLKTLIDLDILVREVPITEENPAKSKRGLYKIKDNFLGFWFRFVYPNLGMLEIEKREFVLNKIKRNFADNHVSFVYEDICLDEMWKLNSEDKWNFNFDRCGRWWDKSTEIDIVAYDSKGKDIIFGECKYTTGPKDIDVLWDLEAKAREVKWNNNNRNQYFILFSINGFTAKLEELAAKRSDILLKM